jgi:hypothetical protein
MEQLKQRDKPPKTKRKFCPKSGNLWGFSVILSVVPTTIGSLFHFGRFGFDPFYRVKIHKITSVTDKEWGDIGDKRLRGLAKPQEQADRLPPPRTLILDFTLTHTRFGRSHVYSTGHLTHTRCWMVLQSLMVL